VFFREPNPSSKNQNRHPTKKPLEGKLGQSLPYERGDRKNINFLIQRKREVTCGKLSSAGRIPLERKDKKDFMNCPGCIKKE